MVFARLSVNLSGDRSYTRSIELYRLGAADTALQAHKDDSYAIGRQNAALAK